LRFNYSAKHNTRSPKKYFIKIVAKKCQNFIYDFFFLEKKKLALQFREGRDKGTRLNVSLYFFLFGFFSQKIFHFFSWVIFF